MKKRNARNEFKPIEWRHLSPEEEELWNKQDYIGLEYLHCEQTRLKRRKNADEAKKLAEHDALEKRIQVEPDKVLREAHEAIDRGTEIFFKLIRSGRMSQTVWPSKEGEAEGVRPWRSDQAVSCLESRVSFLNRQFIRLAEDNSPGACRHLWFAAKELAEAFTRLALVHPEEFRECAASSLTMPSLRALNPKFNADAEEIAKAIHLSEEHPAPDILDNRTRAGAECHRLVVSILEHIFSERRSYKWEKESLGRLKEFHETAELYRGVTLERVLRSQMHPDVYEQLMACANLPEWKENRMAWWKGRVLPMVKEEFKRLQKDHNRNPSLWAALKEGGERNTENDMRRYLEKTCHNKFKQIAKNTPRSNCL